MEIDNGQKQGTAIGFRDNENQQKIPAEKLAGKVPVKYYAQP